MNLNDILIDPRQTITAVAGSAITAGDLVTMLESGTVAKTNEVLGIANENNTTQGPVALRAITAIENDNDYGAQTIQHNLMCALGNGNIAIGYTGNGTNSSDNINVRIRTSLGAGVVSRKTLYSGSNCGAVRCVKLSSTQFIAAYCATSSSLRFTILNNDGSTAVAETTVATIDGLTPNDWNIAVLADGGFVIVYDKATLRDCAFKRYNASGVLQGSETTIEAASQPNCIAVIGYSSGGFVVKYLRGAATVEYKIARYDASGVIVGSLTTLQGSTPGILTYGNVTNTLIELSNGNIAAAFGGPGDSYPDIKVLNSSLTILATIDLGTSSFTTNGENPCLVRIANGFAVFHRNGATQTSISTYDNIGGELLGRTTFGATAIGSDTSVSGSGVTAFAIGSVGYVVLRVGYEGGTPNYDVRLMCINSVGTLVGSEVVLRASGTSVIYDLGAVLTDAGTLALSYKEAGGNHLGDAYYNIQRRSVLGVANSTVSSGADVVVKTKGSYDINQTFGAGGAFDNRSAVVVGTKGAVSGGSAILQGVSA